MDEPARHTERQTRLRRLFDEHSMRVFAYASRQVGAAAAQDVVSEVFLVAWRRIDEVPSDALPWLLVVARNIIGNGRRSTVRQRRLADRVANLARASTAVPGADEIAVERRTMLAALADLSAAEREAVLLIAWDGLSVAQAADVAGCSRRAFELRLHRARNRLRAILGDAPPRTPAPRPAPLSLIKETTS